MESATKDQSPKPCINKENYRRSSTFSINNPRRLTKQTTKRVKFVDRAQNLPLCTIFNYDKIEILPDDSSPKRTQSCACSIF